MKSKIIVTDDNSKTLLIPELNETYHSTRGAITESLHVFIKEGLDYTKQNELNIFEMGFGTGLNAIITLKQSILNHLKINYHTIEFYPLDFSVASSLNYLEDLEIQNLKEKFDKMHKSGHDQLVNLNPEFSFKKFISSILKQDLNDDFYDLIYYDAFGPKVQSELWDIPILQKIYRAIKPGGFLVTYCSQGQFKRNLRTIGFRVESIPGPPGKREMTRAFK